MPNLFDYLDFREYLSDYYKEKKANKASFSYQVFAKKAGFKSKSFLPHVIEGKRDLSQNSVFKIGNALDLEGQAYSYFEDLVAFNQSKNVKQKSHFFLKLATYKKATKARQIQENQYEYFANWYHSTIRELVTMVPFEEDYEKLGKYVSPLLSPKEAKESVKLLLNLGLIEKAGDIYKQTDRAITTGNEVQSITVENFHQMNLDLAKTALNQVQRMDRDVSCMIIGLSEKGFMVVKEKIQKFRKELSDLVQKDEAAQKVYHINFQLFPTSKANDHV